MKVFMVLIFAAFGCASARGSGPYLPSGWTPSGPEFYLPSEVTKPSETPTEESQVFETEASSSDAFREYGPPKLEEISIKQDLPEIVTGQAFFVDVNSAETVTPVEHATNIEANTQSSTNNEEKVSTATEPQVAEQNQAVEEQVTESSKTQTTTNIVVLDLVETEVVQSEEPKIQENIDSTTVAFKDETVVPTAAYEENAVPLSQQELVQDAITYEEAVIQTEKVHDAVAVSDTGVPNETGVSNVQVEQDIVPIPFLEVVDEKVIEGENSIAEIIVENKVKESEAPVVGDISSNQETSGALEQAPEGFLDYNPPGFAIYGPPNQEDLSRLAPTEVITGSSLDNNEVRRRRFSPKLRSRNH